jgi:acetyltransferase-like isoleucine patch superfamily enzyme
VKISSKASLDKSHLMSIGHRSRIDDFCAISGYVTIGSNVHIAVHSSITASLDEIVLSDFSGLAFSCHVFSSSDDYSGESLTNPTIPIAYKSVKSSPVFLGRHVILGAGTIVFPGTTIGDGCSFGAGSVVNRNAEPWGVYVGIPARRIKERSKNLLTLEIQYLSDHPYHSRD